MSDRDWQLEYETQKHRADAAEKGRIAVRGELKEMTEALREVRFMLGVDGGASEYRVRRVLEVIDAALAADKKSGKEPNNVG